MRSRFAIGAGVIVVLVSVGHGAEFKSGPQVGDGIGAYSTTKCNDADDGVKQGKSLCYT